MIRRRSVSTPDAFGLAWAVRRRARQGSSFSRATMQAASLIASAAAG
jgi:hypothetical protein